MSNWHPASLGKHVDSICSRHGEQVALRLFTVSRYSPELIVWHECVPYCTVRSGSAENFFNRRAALDDILPTRLPHTSSFHVCSHTPGFRTVKRLAKPSCGFDDRVPSIQRCQLARGIQFRDIGDSPLIRKPISVLLRGKSEGRSS